ncbi:D-alanine--D-alanine ligase [Flavobacterium sp. F372]|uniref:D-alanine--D-alanine ligase n=1 Tax=Flavobacterium bernardetii TaxID=2813823 RepID=A0ABR7IWB7_9FLAO|nr:D-alanine--D-alanine ligase [Flavobacterium bernardetii]MBC5834076.1 D-alanine--D-alanine ligase [Flavobacterium bernardetii]NHF69308.1 D-alanine--D-alanine ligase [Flavobacterium bernardetii]
MKLFIHKVLNWEYWPFGIVYFPIFFLWVYYSIKAKTIFFFNAANPKIKNGGFMNESKIEIYYLIPKQYYPKTSIIRVKTPIEAVLKGFNVSNFNFPLILKPDMGLRGNGVKKITNLEELKDYHAKADFDFLIQDVIPFENEVGIFYVKLPNETKGKITGIVSKEYLIVEGDGTHTIEQLIKQTPRFEFQLKALQKEYKDKLLKVLLKGEKVNLVPYGNHARGAKFIDSSHLISEKLNNVIENISKDISEFYFGRFDIMYNTFEELENGQNFSIVELNGSGSEPTHIYDPKHNIFFAWKELARHIGYMYKIGKYNNDRGFKFLNYTEGMKEYKAHNECLNKIVSI